jgi:hypothetical protein
VILGLGALGLMGALLYWAASTEDKSEEPLDADPRALLVFELESDE